MTAVGHLDLSFHVGPVPIDKAPCLVLCDDRSIRLAYCENETWVFLGEKTATPPAVTCWAMISADETTRINFVALEALAAEARR